MDSPQLIRLLDLADLTEVSEARGVSPRSLYIEGRDFSSVESVAINGLVSPEFAVLTPTRIIAEVPEPIRNSTIVDVAVFSQNLTLTDRSLVEFTFGTRPRTARGVIRLMQNFLRILLRTPGTNVFHPEAGGGLLRSIGGVITPRSAADVQLAVSRTLQYVQRAQSRQREIPPQERLLAAEIMSLNTNPAQTSLHVSIVLTNHAGQRVGSTLVA